MINQLAEHVPLESDYTTLWCEFEMIYYVEIRETSGIGRQRFA